MSTQASEAPGDDKIRCDACPVTCYIRPGMAGACDRYANRDGELVRVDPHVLLQRALAQGERLVPFSRGEGDWDGKLVADETLFVTAVGAGTTYPDYKPAPFIVSSQVDGVDMVTVVTEGIFSYCGVKVKVDTDRFLGPEQATVRCEGEAVGHVTTGEYGSQMLALGGVHHLTGGSKKEGRVTCEALMNLANGKPVERPIWIENLTGIVAPTHAPDAHGAFTVTPKDLLKAVGFCHLNTTILRRDLFKALGGLDENIRYECDRDFYLRLIDRARLIKYHPSVTSRHNIPDPAKSASMSTLVSDLEKRLFQLTVLDKSALLAVHPEIREHCRTHKPYVLKKLAEGLSRRSEFSSAAYYAREALAIGFSFKWLLFTLALTARALWRPSARLPRGNAALRPGANAGAKLPR